MLCVVEVEVSASDWSLDNRSPTECGASKCERGDSIRRRPRPTGGRCTMGGNKICFIMAKTFDVNADFVLAIFILSTWI